MAELPDKNVEAVILQMRKRALTGFLKYNTTTEREDVDLAGWLQHLQEELMDACVYVERMKKEVAKMQERLNNYSWDVENARQADDERRGSTWT